tara:strand:- start:58 stop:291 length:234 start_codon:yes stop_codon:yes gene_type:complete
MNPKNPPMDDILNKIRVSREKEILTNHEKMLNKALDYLASIENTDQKQIESIRAFLSRVIDEEIDFLVRNPEDYFEE